MLVLTGISNPLVELDRYVVVLTSPPAAPFALALAAVGAAAAALGAVLPHDPFDPPAGLIVSAAGVALRVMVCSRPLLYQHCISVAPCFSFVDESVRRIHHSRGGMWAADREEKKTLATHSGIKPNSIRPSASLVP